MIEILYWIHNNLFQFGNGELIGYIDESGVGFLANLCLLLIPFIVIISYYIVIDHPKLSNNIIWVVTILIISIITAFVIDGFIYDYVLGYIEKEIPGESIEKYSNFFLNIGFVNFLISLIVSLILSSLIRKGSKNCSKTPF
jgi:hypothetical protein